jgi:DNA-binding LacI/PurR family transcriptional regulator
MRRPNPASESARRVTTHDVARKAGVSQATVSLVLGGNPRARVSATTRERVMHAAGELGYRPNMLARALVQRKSYTIGVMVPDLSNPFFMDVVTGAQRVAAEAGYVVLPGDVRDTSPTRHLDALRARQVDGLILDGFGALALPESELAGLKVVLVDEPSERFPGVASDAPAAGRLAAEHLLALGHARFGFIGPASGIYVFRMRERGFFQALRAAGHGLSSARLRRVPPSVAGGLQAMRALLALAEDERPTAVFCATDLLAAGALKACLTAGVAVPGRMSIVGCDDVELARVLTPELTTIRIPARELGARAARLLIKQIDDEAWVPRPGKALPVKLVVRGTTGPVDRE